MRVSRHSKGLRHLVFEEEKRVHMNFKGMSMDPVPTVWHTPPLTKMKGLVHTLYPVSYLYKEMTFLNVRVVMTSGMLPSYR